MLTVWLIPGSLPAQPEGLVYTRVGARGAPSERIDAPIAYDAVGRRLLMFGGQDTSARNDLWAFSCDRQEWTELKPSGTRPPARFGHTTIFDPVRRRLIVFGGQSAGFFSDVWAYDVARNAWQQLRPNDAGPSRRYGHSAIYESARDRMIISHGFTDAGRFDDTWAFQLSTNTWQNISPSGPRPLRRCLHHAVYDERNSQMLLYGGCASGNGPCPLDDLWSFDLNMNRWTERTPASRPPARQWYGMAFDSARARLVLFGGSGSRGSLNDTWEYDPAANAWRQITPAGDAPAPRSRHEATFVPELRAALFFGGRADTGLTNELLMLAPAASAPRFSSSAVVNAFSGQSGAVAPGEIVSIFGTGLGPAIGSAATVDPATGRLSTSVAGVSVTWNGVPAPIYFARADQVNAQAPYELASSVEASIIVTYNGVASPPQGVAVVAAHPGLFPGVFNQDGSVNSPDNPALAGSIVTLFGTGQGVTDPPSGTGVLAADVFPIPAAPVELQIGGRTAELLFRGHAPGTAGVIQINARIPEGLAAGSAAPVVFRVGGAESQPGVVVHVR